MTSINQSFKYHLIDIKQQSINRLILTSLIDFRSLAMSFRTDDSFVTASSLSCFLCDASVWKLPTN
jgi:hypothetical protein